MSDKIEPPEVSPEVPSSIPDATRIADIEAIAQVQRAMQLSFPAVQQAVEMIRGKMRSDGVPRFDDGVTRSLLGSAIAIAKNAGVENSELLKQMIDEVFSTIIFTAPTKLVQPNGKKLEIVKR